MKYTILSVLLLLKMPSAVLGQKLLSLQEAEDLFLKQNIEIQEGQAELYVAESAIRQAKLLNNPELSIDQVNLWSSKSQREDVTIPPILGSSIGKNTQFSVELGQEIRLGGKRKKGIQIARLNHRLSSLKQAYTSEEALLHFRSLIFEYNFYKSYQTTLEEELNILKQISKTYKKQRELGFIATSEWMRIQAAEYEAEQELLEVRQEWNELKELIHSLLGISVAENIEVFYSPEKMELPSTLFREQMHHPLLQIGREEMQLKRKSLALEKAQRIPDIRLSGNYDRFGGVWSNFIGFGISFTLPVWNRNQGNIKAAQMLLHLEQNKLNTQKIAIQNKIQTELHTYHELTAFKDKLKQDLSNEDLKKLQQSYVKNLLQKNISLIEFLDFTETYKQRQKMLLETDKKIYTQYFTLLYTIGNKTIQYEN